MIHIKRFEEIFENVAVHRGVKPEKLPHCAEMEAKGYRIATLGGEKYAFHKNYEMDDEIYWFGEDIDEFKNGKKYVATQELISQKENLPFYSIYCKCDPSPTEEQRKIIAEREKEIKKEKERREKEREKIIKEKQKKKK